MKVKSPAQVYDSFKNTSQDIIKHLQAVTDDVRNILKGGLSFSDAQLPFQIQPVNVISGQPVNLNIQLPYRIVGCFPIQTNGVAITSFQTNLSNGTLTVTVTMSVTSANISFLVVGTNI